MREFKAITNRNEYISAHYLSELLAKDLGGVRSRWKAAQLAGLPNSAQGLRGLNATFQKAKSEITEGLVEDDPDVAILALKTDPRRIGRQGNWHDALLDALAYPAAPAGGDSEASGSTHQVTRRAPLDVVHLGAERLVHTALTVTGPGGLELVALDATWSGSVDQATDSDEGARLIDPVKLDGRHELDSAVEAAGFLFACEPAPRYVLLLAGGAIVLADASVWHEGRYLALDLDMALGNDDETVGGELDTAAALFGAESLLTQDGGDALSELLDKGRKHAVGVSKELREGLRESVQLIAQEILDRIEQHGAEPADLGDDLAKRLTQQSLRYLYRILFLLYAEARPELGILPSKDDAYQNGYGLARLAELVSYELPDEARDGLYFYKSLDLLFTLVDQGHNENERSGRAEDADVGIRFESLRSELFAASATELIGSAINVGGVSVDTRLRNGVLWEVLEKLMLTREGSKDSTSGRGYISYAQLGINQLGAVYEGLMSYTGFFADQDLNEVAKDGDPAKGTWVVPVDRADEYEPSVFVLDKEPDRYTGERRRVLHKRGSFVYRLSGRERQRSASYYTPEILTEFTVRHALAELLDQDGKTTSSAEILKLTVCEPALGSGAFLNEAIRQLAAQYLERAQKERGEGTELPPDKYEVEFQKVKAYIALHNAYGVDLNQTAVELAEVSLWLNAMHEGLRAPWFGLHLRRGNSLIGARRAVYDKAELKARKWLTTPPTERPLFGENGEVGALGSIGETEIHHFLLPAHGWGTVADAKQAKELAADDREALAEWRKTVRKQPSVTDQKRLLALATRVERLWELARKRLTVSEDMVRRDIPVWGLETEARPEWSGGAVDRKEVEAALTDQESPLQRLELVMNAWCALWFWPVGQPYTPAPPSFEEWLEFLEAVLGLPAPKPKKASGGKYGDVNAAAGDLLGMLDAQDDFAALAVEDKNDRIMSRSHGMLDVTMKFPWLGAVNGIVQREGFFHWELRFAQVFAKGGFDLQVGNPPWVRPTWDDALALAEFDPWFGLTEKVPQKIFEARRELNLTGPRQRQEYLAELSSWAGLNEHLGSTVEHPVLVGVQTNLYTNFMEQAWRNLGRCGAIGLIHPETHFTDPKGGVLRQATYSRLRRHFHFRNTLKIFEEIRDTINYSIQTYGAPQAVEFICMNWLYRPDTADRSLSEDVPKYRPGLQLPWGGWDTRPHPDRAIVVTDEVLGAWAALVDPPETPNLQARLLRPLTVSDNEALRVVSRFPERLSSHEFMWTRGLEEDRAKQDGLVEWRSSFPRAGQEVILQGPFFTVATPLAKQPNPVCKSNSDYTGWDLVELGERVIPRTNYQRVAERDDFEDSQIKKEDGVYLPSRSRVAWRRMTATNTERGLHAALLPPGPTHFYTVLTLALTDNRQTSTVAGLWASLPLDYLVKVSGKADITVDLARQFPTPVSHPLTTPLLHRALRLNCLIRDYALIWDELYDTTWAADTWTATDSHATVPLGSASNTWSMQTPLRTDYDRRMALVEIDALVALMLGLTAEQLCAMYRSQFAVLRKYEWDMFFAPDGHQIGTLTHNRGVRQTEDETELAKAWRKAKLNPEEPDPEIPADWIKPDREAEMTHAYNEFARRLAAGEYPEIEA